MTDAFDQLRITDDPGTPDPHFVAGLRNRLAAALDAAGLPTIDLPERSTTMSETSTTTTAPSTAPAAPAAPGTATSTLTPYICVSDGVAAIDWYVAVLGAVEQVRYTGDDGRIGHAELAVGGARLMLSSEYPEMGVSVVSPTTLGGTPFSLHLEVPDVDAVFERVVADGRSQIGRPPHDEAYGARSFDMVDPFGHRWMIQTPIGNPSVEEIESQMEGYTITEPAPAPAAPVVEVGYLTFATPDVVRASQFYGALFGWQAEAGEQGDEHAHVANTRLPMGLTTGPVDEAPVLYFRVDDIAGYVSRVTELGGTVLSQTTYASGPNAVCRDDQGREFQLWQPAPGFE